MMLIHFSVNFLLLQRIIHQPYLKETPIHHHLLHLTWWHFFRQVIFEPILHTLFWTVFSIWGSYLFCARRMRTHILSDALVHNIYASGSSEVTLQKKERNATSKTFFFSRIFFSGIFCEKWKLKLLPLIHLTASECVLLLFLQIILLFSMIVSCRTKKS